MNGRLSKGIPENRFMGENKAAPNYCSWGRYLPLYTAQGGRSSTLRRALCDSYLPSYSALSVAAPREMRTRPEQDGSTGVGYPLRASWRPVCVPTDPRSGAAGVPEIQIHWRVTAGRGDPPLVAAVNCPGPAETMRRGASWQRSPTRLGAVHCWPDHACRSHV